MLRTLACGLCLASFCLAQESKLIVSPADPVHIKPGATATATLKVTTLPGFHVNSDKPKDEFLIPLKLTWSDGPLEVKAVTYPTPETIKVGKDVLSVFTGSFNIATEFKAPQSASRGTSAMAGKLRYQACNNQMCFRQSTVDVRVPVEIE